MKCGTQKQINIKMLPIAFQPFLTKQQQQPLTVN
jgi:hypothetical protein